MITSSAYSRPTHSPRRSAIGLAAAIALSAAALAGCTSAQQAEEAGSPSESVLCGTVITSIAALQQQYDALDAGIAAGESPTNLQPIGAEINSLTFDVVNQLQGASKESLTTVQDSAQSIVDTLVKAQGSGTTGDALAQQINAAQPDGVDAAIADLTAFANDACAGQ